MKKLPILLLFVISFSFTSFSFGQNIKENDVPKDSILKAYRKNEFRLNVLPGILVSGNIEFSYEYVISKHSGVGGSITIRLADNGVSDVRFAVTPYYRQYFFNKKDYGAKGFFVEGFVNLTSLETDESFFEELLNINQEEEVTRFSFGLGTSIGYKWVTQNGFTFEISGGGGRRFGDFDGFFDELLLRGGLSVGYRFF